jgi:exoribonuclease R
MRKLRLQSSTASSGRHRWRLTNDSSFAALVPCWRMELKLLKLLGSEDYVPSNVPELLSQLGMKPNQQQVLQSLLKSLEKQGKIIRTKGNRYIVAKEADLIPGVIQITRGGRGFVQPDEAGITEISIPESATDTAMHGDRVLVRLDVRSQGLRKPGPQEQSGSVVRVLERKRTQFVGTLQRSKQFLHVTPDDPRLPGAVYVSEPRDVGRKPNIGDKVVVEITQWESKQTAPEGEIIEVLGPPDEEGVDMLSVLRHYDLPLSFPKNVLHEAQTIAKSRPDNQPGARNVRAVSIAGRTTSSPSIPMTRRTLMMRSASKSTAGSVAAVGSHRRCVALRASGQRAGCGGEEARQLDLPRGPRDPDAAGGAEQ